MDFDLVANLDPTGMSDKVPGVLSGLEGIWEQILDHASSLLEEMVGGGSGNLGSGDESASGVDISSFMARVESELNSMFDEVLPDGVELLIDSYVRGIVRAYDDVEEEASLADRKAFLERFVANARAKPGKSKSTPSTPPRDAWGAFMSAKAHELSERLAKGWKQQSSVVSQEIAKIVTSGISTGKSVKGITSEIRGLSKDIPLHRARAIAQTEVTRAHAEGQLESYSRLGVQQVSTVVDVELMTAMDGKVCPDCVLLAKRGPIPIANAYGLLPVHVGCRCAWKLVKSPVVGAVTNTEHQTIPTEHREQRTEQRTITYHSSFSQEKSMAEQRSPVAVARIRFSNGTIELQVGDDGYRWVAVDPSKEDTLAFELDKANYLSSPLHYEYNPGDGMPGYALASNLAGRMGGELEILAVPRRNMEETEVVY